MAWAQLVAGPPGSGKTTYCRAMLEVCKASGRPAAIINLDPANDRLPYDAAVNIFDLVAVSDVMEAFELGPNGALQYAIEFLEANMEWLEERLRPLVQSHTYMLFDTPGQAELYATHESLARVLDTLARRLDIRFVAVHLVDSHHCTDPYKFVAAATLSLQAMLRLSLPHLNVLSKADLAHNFIGAHAEHGLDSFTDMLDLTRILPLEEEQGQEGEMGAGVEPVDDEERGVLDAVKRVQDGAEKGKSSGSQTEDPARTRERTRRTTMSRRLRTLNERLVEVLTDFNLLSFTPVSVTDPASLIGILSTADKAHGFVAVK